MSLKAERWRKAQLLATLDTNDQFPALEQIRALPEASQEVHFAGTAGKARLRQAGPGRQRIVAELRGRNDGAKSSPGHSAHR